ncbi:MAG: hypothetical protein ABFD18_07535 [Syntrophomonas sp.]
MKCNLNITELEDIYLLFGKINRARAEIMAGIDAQEDYAETINEINQLTTDDSEYGEELCGKALKQLGLIKAAELAQVSIHNYRTELETKYEIPSGQSKRGQAVNE